MKRFDSRPAFAKTSYSEQVLGSTMTLSCFLGRTPRACWNRAACSSSLWAAVIYASVESGVASFSAPRRRHPYEDVFRQRAPQQEIRIRDPPKRRLLLVWASIGCQSDVVGGSDGVCWVDHGDDRPLLIWRSRPRFEVVSSCTEERASNVSGKLRFKAQRPRAG